MALNDYYLCDCCRNKTFYDASLNYDFDSNPETGLDRTADMLALCPECAKTHKVVIIKRETLEILRSTAHMRGISHG